MGLDDDRGGEVLFVAHCLLNENVRYPGGAFRRGTVAEVVDEAARRGWGIVQLPCPEQHAWGGVSKRHLRRAYGRSLGPLRRPAVRVAVAWTRLRYARPARTAARQIEDYVRSGVRVVGVIGVDESPSCGVHTRLDLACAATVVARCPLATGDRDATNEALLVGCRVAGEGMFVRALRRRLAARGITVPFGALSILAERDVAAGAPAAGPVVSWPSAPA